MDKLGQLLVTRGWISVQQLTRALKNQQVVGGQLGTCLLEIDALSEELLLKGLSEQLGVPAASIDDLRSVSEDALAVLPPKVARRCRAVPIRLAGGRLDVAMLEPHNLTAQDELAFATSKRVKVHVLHEARVHEALDRYYGEEPPDRFVHLIDRLNRARYLWERGDQPDELSPPPRRVKPARALGLDTAAAPARPLDDELEFSLPELPSPPPPRPRPLPAPPASPAPSAVAVAAPPPARSAAAPVPPPPARPRTTVGLTPSERAALGAGPAPSVPSLASLPELEEAFAAAAHRDQLASLLVGFLARSYPRVALFRVVRERVAGWMARGDGIDPDRFARFAFGFDQPSAFLNLRQGSRLHLGPLASMPAHRDLAACWGGELPRDCLLLPVRVRERLVAVLYLDAAGSPLGRIDLEGLQRLAAAMGGALERLILQQKKKRSGER